MMLVRHDPSSAGVARHQIAADLQQQSLTPDSIDDVVLVVSELVGNAITHCHDEGDLDIAWELEEDVVIVRVNDTSPDEPTLKQVDTNSVNGRGLAIVAAIAVEWGVVQIDQGKQVWARVPVHHLI